MVLYDLETLILRFEAGRFIRVGIKAVRRFDSVVAVAAVVVVVAEPHFRKPFDPKHQFVEHRYEQHLDPLRSKSEK